MRFVVKDLNNIPSVLKSTKALKNIEDIANSGDKNIIDDKIYKGEYKDANNKSQSKVRDCLNEFYFGKCAYCEEVCKAEIEHYRPKKGITGLIHDGYYWLCYEWSNLLPSCRYCNTEGGKGNQFPIIKKQNRVLKPSFDVSKKLDISKNLASSAPLILEEPYLLHPEIDQPEDYLEFKINADKKGIEAIGIDTLSRGNETIKICNLNRVDLQTRRLKSVYYPIKQRINLAF